MSRSFVVALIVALVAALPAEARKRGRNGVLSIDSTVRGATVLVDGRVVGKAPLKQPVPPGAHTVTVRQLGFLEFTDKVSVRPGDTHQVVADLLPFAGVIKVNGPARAQVLVDGKVIGEAPLEREIKIGRHTVEVKAGGQTHTEIITAAAGAQYAIIPKLAGVAEDELALAPLTAPGNDDDPLSLAPLPSTAGGSKPHTPAAGTAVASSSSAGPPESETDDLSLEPLPAIAEPPHRIAAVDPTLRPPLTSGPTAATTLEPPSPWYTSWWAWTAAGVVVLSGAVYAAKSLSGRGDKTDQIPVLYPGDNCPDGYSCPAGIILGF